MFIGAHLPRGVSEGLVNGHLGQLLERPSAKRAAGGREQDATQRAVAFSLVAQAVQALVDRGVLGVDRHDLCARGKQGPLHHRAGRDQRLFIGQRQAASSLQRTESDGQAGETDNPVQNYVSLIGDSRQSLIASQDLGALRDEVSQFAGLRRVCDGYLGGVEIARLRPEGSY